MKFLVSIASGDVACILSDTNLSRNCIENKNQLDKNTNYMNYIKYIWRNQHQLKHRPYII